MVETDPEEAGQIDPHLPHPVVRMPRPLLARYGISLGLVFVVFLLRTPIEKWAGDGASPILYLPAVTLAAWYGGLAPGLAAIVLSGLLWVYFDIDPIGSLTIPSPVDRFRIAVFALEGVLLSVLMEMLHAARRASERYAREAERYREASGRNEARLRAILENASTPIWMKDASGCYMLANRPFENLTQRSVPEILGKSDTDLFLPPIAGPLHANDRAVLESGGRSRPRRPSSSTTDFIPSSRSSFLSWTRTEASTRSVGSPPRSPCGSGPNRLSGRGRSGSERSAPTHPSESS